jgi:two-component system chemotaxis response regulator CheB
VLVVDDSAVLRLSTRFILESDPELNVVGEAGNGADAITLVDRLRPDVITMDIQMPKMDGMDAIRQIMAEHPVPIVVVTGIDLDQQANISTQATRLGAVSVVKRPAGVASAHHLAFARKLIEQVKLMSTVRVVHRPRSAKSVAADVTGPPPEPAPPAATRTEIVAIGSSTGGPAALHTILSALPGEFPAPIVIVQHISFGFVEGLASWLNDACKLRVKVGRQGEKIQAGTVYIAPDDNHALIDRLGRVGLSPSEPVGGHRPSVTSLFQSVAQSYGRAAMAVILTGMGADGAIGVKALSEAGAITIAQDEASCVVFGMPKEAIALGGVQHIVPLDKIAQTFQELIVV